uniref:Maturase n=1 Tax=Rhodochaete parvula TaxID=110510 RepID=A0A220T0J8_9RHOD|nr:maturase [Rhodochaete parvula]
MLLSSVSKHKLRLEVVRYLRITDTIDASDLIWKTKLSNIDEYHDITNLILLILDLSKQTLVKLALQPQLYSKLRAINYKFQICCNYYDTIKALNSSLSDCSKYVLNINLINSLKNLDYNLFLQQLNIPNVLKTSIESWLAHGLLDEYICQSQSFDLHLANKPKGNILSSSLINILLYDLSQYLRHEVLNSYNSSQLGCELNFIIYDHYLILSSVNKSVLYKIFQSVTNWLLRFSMKLDKYSYDLKLSSRGFNFLNYNISFFSRSAISTSLFIQPSLQVMRLFVQKNREIIHNLRSSPLKLLIKILSQQIIVLGKFYGFCNVNEVFKTIDHVLFLQLSSLIIERHPRKPRYWIKKHYFPNSQNYYFAGTYYISSWVLIDPNCLDTYYLPKIQWLVSFDI